MFDRPAFFGSVLYRRAAGKAESEDARALVESLAGSVVERASEDLVDAVLMDQQEFGVPSGDDQADGREDWLRGGSCAGGRQPVRVDVTLQVVDRDERLVPGHRDRLG